MKTNLRLAEFMRLPLAAGLLINAAAIAAESSESPLSPAEELTTFHFADSNLTAELVAAEPDVVAPVALAWDADGRLFVWVRESSDSEILSFGKPPTSTRPFLPTKSHSLTA